MARFLRENGSQETRYVMMLAQAHGETESFSFFERMFGPIAEQLYEIENNTIAVDSKQVQVLPLFSCDLKATWAMCGISGANCAHPCPFCSVHLSKLDQNLQKAMQNPAGARPQMDDLRGKARTDFQKEDTFNLFNIRFSSNDGTYANILPAILHIKIGIGNKIIAALDLVIKEWANLKEDEELAQEHLGFCLSGIGAHRKNYFKGQLSGGQCTILFSKLDILLDYLFHKRIGTMGTISEQVPGAEVLEADLRRLSKLYNGM